jgi:hypothetical protein
MWSLFITTQETLRDGATGVFLHDDCCYFPAHFAVLSDHRLSLSERD